MQHALQRCQLSCAQARPGTRPAALGRLCTPGCSATAAGRAPYAAPASGAPLWTTLTCARHATPGTDQPAPSSASSTQVGTRLVQRARVGGGGRAIHSSAGPFNAGGFAGGNMHGSASQGAWCCTRSRCTQGMEGVAKLMVCPGPAAGLYTLLALFCLCTPPCTPRPAVEHDRRCTSRQRAQGRDVCLDLAVLCCRLPRSRGATRTLPASAPALQRCARRAGLPQGPHSTHQTAASSDLQLMPRDWVGTPGQLLKLKQTHVASP